MWLAYKPWLCMCCEASTNEFNVTVWCRPVRSLSTARHWRPSSWRSVDAVPRQAAIL